METKLSVRNLRISFRTSNGKVQAVRGINFDLAKGETLAIVGESGSGKSVTSKAILGIQAANAITESGEIIYDGQDLLKITEEDFHKIRGDKIAMIFQDPMSSLNPIVKIGKQLTEAMLLKGKARQRESRSNFNGYLKRLEKAMVDSDGQEHSTQDAHLKDMCKRFDKFEFKHIELERGYNTAQEAALEAMETIESLSFELEKDAAKDAFDRLRDICTQAKLSINPYVVSEDAAEVKQLARTLMKKYRQEKKQGTYTETVRAMRRLGELLKAATEKQAPNFFRLGYYMTYAKEPVPDLPVDQLDERLKEYIDDSFMTEFIAHAKDARKFTASISYTNMERAIEALTEAKPIFQEEKLDAKRCRETQKKLCEAVKATIDPLATLKDSPTYTFPYSLVGELDTYFHAIRQNQKAMEEYEKNKKKHDALVAKGKNPDWQVAAAAVTDLELVKSNILRILESQIEHYQALLSERDNRDYDAQTIESIDYLMHNASGVVAKVTPAIAKRRAIKLMDEVGIAEPHKRYNQYPFEFSGGMRQRIVIAIALAADPDILICDEPTTALDVTIQSQILELINKLKQERQLSVIFITHDLGVVANIADRVAVMYAGKIVEYGTSADVFYEAAHPYTWALLSSMPDLDTNEKLEAIPGTPPNMIYPPVGDAFAPRNKYAMKIDFEKQPPMFKISDTHYAATWLLHPDAPKVEPPRIVLDRIERMKSKGGKRDAE